MILGLWVPQEKGHGTLILICFCSYTFLVHTQVLSLPSLSNTPTQSLLDSFSYIYINYSILYILIIRLNLSLQVIQPFHDAACHNHQSIINSFYPYWTYQAFHVDFHSLLPFPFNTTSYLSNPMLRFYTFDFSSMSMSHLHLINL